MDVRNLKRLAYVGLALLATGMSGIAGAVGVTATVGATTDSNSGSNASVTLAGSTATATRTLTQAFGTISNVYTSQQTLVAANANSQFTIIGLIGSVPLTFNVEFSGTRLAAVDNASFQSDMKFELQAPGVVDNVGWGISYVDGGAPEGDFSGVLSAPFGAATAGSAFVNSLPAGNWDGQGTRMLAVTLTGVGAGSQGSMYLQSQFGFSGGVTADYSTRLVSVTVANGAQIAPGAHLLLDDGSQVLITAVPEPETWAMLLAGLALVSMRSRRRA